MWSVSARVEAARPLGDCVTSEGWGRAMTRLAIELPNAYPRKFVWFMECDKCRTTRSNPAWSHDDLPLGGFRLLGWQCGDQTDSCPKCVAESVVSPVRGE